MRLRRIDLWAVVVSLLCAVVALAMMLRFRHPSGSDPGQWLSMAKLYLGESGADLNVLQYPPLFFILLAATVWVTGNAIAALFLAMGALIFLLSLCAYCAYLAVTADARGAIIFAACVGLGQSFLDMVSWGAYPNLFSFPFLLLACAWLFRCSRPNARAREFLLLGLFAGLVFLCHPLSSLLFGAGAATFAILIYARDRRWRWLIAVATRSLPVFAVLYIPYISAAVLTGAYRPSYLTDQPTYSFGGALLPLIPWFLRACFPFGAATTVVAIVGVVAAAAFPLAKGRIGRDRGTWLAWILYDLEPAERAGVYALFFAMLVPPFLVLGALGAFGQYSDFTRLMFFPGLPGAAAMAAVLSRWIGAADAGERFQGAAPAGASGLPRGRLAHVLRRSTSWLPGQARPVRLVVVLLLVVNGASGLVYFDQATRFYTVFDDAADLQLSEWVASKAQLSDVVLLAPAPDSAGSIKWLEGLTGRHTIGYREARELYYPSERAASHDAYVMLSYVYAIASSDVEVGTPGLLPSDPLDVRYTVFDGFTPVPILDMNDSGTALELDNGAVVNLSALNTHSVMLDSSVAGAPSIVARAYDAAMGIEVVRLAYVQGKDVQTQISVTSTRAQVLALRVHLGFASPLCSAKDPPGGALVNAGTFGLCAQARIRPSLGFSLNITPDGLDLRLPTPFGQASIAFENLGTGTLLSGDARVLQSKQIVHDRGVRFIAVDRHESWEVEFLDAAYGYPTVYENEKYTVYGVP